MKCRVQMLADDMRTRERGHLGHSAAVLVVPWQLEDHNPLACDRILENLSELNRPEVGWSRRIGMRHPPILLPALPSALEALQHCESPTLHGAAQSRSGATAGL